jgi:Uncharacterised nucleotidyltransferase
MMPPGVELAGPRPDRYLVETAAVLVRAAASGLDANGRPPLVLTDDRAGAVVAAAARQRLTGHLAAAIDAGDVQASTAVRQAVADAHRTAIRWVLHLEQVLLEVVDVLAAERIDVQVMKGPVVARTIYPQPGIRTFVDIDLLVAGEQFDRATSTLAAAGYRRPVPELRSGFDRRFGKTAMFVDRTGVQVDVHRTLVVGPHGLLIDLADLRAEGGEITVAGRSLRTLGSVRQFLALCYHAALGDVPPRVAALRDVAQMVTGTPGILEAALPVATRWRGRAVVARAVSLATTRLGLRTSPATAWASGYRPDRQERRLLACYTARSNARLYLASVRTLGDPVAATAYLTALLLPQRAVLRVHRRNRARWLWQGVRSLLAGSRRDVVERSGS